MECHGLLLPGQPLLIFPLSRTLAQCSKNICCFFCRRNWTDRPSGDVDRFWRSWGYKGVSGSFNVRLSIPSGLRAAVFLPVTTFCFQAWNGWSSFWHSGEMSPCDLHTAPSSNAVETFLFARNLQRAEKAFRRLAWLIPDPSTPLSAGVVIWPTVPKTAPSPACLE